MLPFAAHQSDPAITRAAWIIVAAVAALVVREIWQAVQSWRDGRRRDKMILSALAREVIAINAIAVAIVNDINRERTMLREDGRWRLKPLLRLPATLYDLSREHIPKSLLDDPRGFVGLLGLQTQCIYTNQLADELMKWKSPAARELDDQLQVIVDFHDPLGESVTQVIHRCDDLLPRLKAAGDKVGGLNLTPVGYSVTVPERDGPPSPGPSAGLPH